MLKCKCKMTVMTVVVCTILLILLGCQTIMDCITPAWVSPQAPEYVGDQPKDIYSLYELKLMQNEIAIQHRDKQLELLRLAEDDTYGFQDAKEFIEPAIQAASDLQNQVIGDDTNPFSVSGLLMLITGGAVGRQFLKRPGDLSPDEHKVKLAEAVNGTNTGPTA